MPYKMEFFDSGLQPYPYDPAKAKQLLAQAGYPHGFNTFLITVSGDVAGQAEAVVVKSELAAVGINVSIQSYAADRLRQGGQRSLADGRAVLDQRHHRPLTRHINAVLRGEEEPRRLAVDTALPVAQGLHDLAGAAEQNR